MESKTTQLFVEVNENNFIFIAGKYDDNQNFQVIDKIKSSKKEIYKENLLIIDNAKEEIDYCIKQIEKKVNYVFKEITIILDIFDISNINVSGYKKLNGSQLLKENISYILNSLKSYITENEKDKTILHILNTKYTIDRNISENLPIGLFGNFYTHELSFFLIKNNDLKNLKQIFAKNNLSVKKVLIKSFVEGSQLIEQKNFETFFRIKISKMNTKLYFFEKSSLRHIENFSFGTDIILKDIKKICSIDFEIINKILSNNLLNNSNLNNEEILDKDYFKENKFRKIRKKLIYDIILARVEEIVNIIYNKNSNLNFLKNKNHIVYISLEDKNLQNNFKSVFQSQFLNKEIESIFFIDDFKENSSAASAAHLSNFGWKKEAIPFTQTEKSIISKIFHSIFG